VKLGNDVDHHRIKLGEGIDIYRLACDALLQWKQHEVGNWVELISYGAPIQVDTTVAILANHVSFYSLSACKIVYCVDEIEEDGSNRRFGFAYGTTPKHVEKGEERFLIEWIAADNGVYYDLLSFSKPANWFIKLGYPVARYVQSSFATASQASMLKAVQRRDLNL